MAKKYVPTLRDKIHSAFGRINKVTLEDSSGNVVREINGPEEFIDFVSKPENKYTISNYIHKVEPKHISEKKPVDSIKSSTSGYRKIVTEATRKNNIRVTHGGRAVERYGEKLSMPSSSQSKFLRGLERDKDSIMNRASDKKIIEIARRKDATRYYKMLDDNQLDEYNSTGEKAEAIRQFVRKRNMTGSNKSVDGYASGIVWDTGKEINSPEMRSLTDMLGSTAFENLDSNLRRNRSNERDALKIMQKKIRKKYGGKGTSSRKVFDEIKDVNNLRTDVETMKYLDSERGEQDIRKRIESKVMRDDMSIKSANSVIKDLNLRGGIINKKSMDLEFRKTTEQKNAIGKVLGYTGSSSGNSLGAKYIYEKLSSNPDAVKTLQKGTDDDIRSKLPGSVSYNDLRAFKGEDITLQETKHFRQAGVEVTGLPPDLEAKLEGTSIKPSTGSGRGRPRGSTGGSGGSYGSKRTQYTKGGSLLGGEEIVYVGGKPVTKKRKGRIAQSLSDAGGSIKSKITPNTKDVRKIYDDLDDRKDLIYLTDEEKRYAAGAGYATRKRIIAKGQKMYRDPAYRAKKFAKKEETKGLYESKLAGAQKKSKRRMKAATSPWWKMWYTLTNNLMVLIGVVIALSILFLPIGLFYVTGWLIAAGLVSLVMFIIWVFIELWFLIAQALVAVINMIGQAIIGIINWVGFTITNAFGQSFTPFEHILVQNMNLVQIDPVTGEKMILGITFGAWNLVPPSFLKLDSFMPTSFDTDTIITKIFPAIRQFFTWYTEPLALRYTNYIATAEWYEIAAILGIPIVLIIIALVVGLFYVRRKMI